MTIGEKVAALSERLRPDVECAPWVIVEVRKIESAYAELAAERDASINGRLVLESKLHFATYRADIAESQLADLAAERDRWKSASLAQSGYAYTAEARADKAESQLAELRGRVEGIVAQAKKHSSVCYVLGETFTSDALNEYAFDLERTLAAADGG